MFATIITVMVVASPLILLCLLPTLSTIMRLVETDFNMKVHARPILNSPLWRSGMAANAKIGIATKFEKMEIIQRRNQSINHLTDQSIIQMSNLA